MVLAFLNKIYKFVNIIWMYYNGQKVKVVVDTTIVIYHVYWSWIA